MKLSNQFISATNELCSFDRHINAPYLRKTFNLNFKPEQAEITICGLGFYELCINGENITKGYLAPYISNTDDVCYYDNYDITRYLNCGENVVGVLLGNGFRNPFGGFMWDFDKSNHIGPLCMALCFEAFDKEQRIEFEADEAFKTHKSPIVFDEYRMGCHYDANIEQPGWDMPGFDDKSWSNAIIIKAPKGKKKLSKVEPITVRKEVSPVKIEYFNELPFAYENTLPGAEAVKETIRKNVYVYDFGQNSAGVTKLKINGKPGQKITIRHGEYLIDGKFTINNIIFKRGKYDQLFYNYFQKDVFICKGGFEEFIPKFKYDGFRYAYVEGLEQEQATKEALTYLVLNSEVEKRSKFNCSDDMINRLWAMTCESDLSNFFYFPNDCPQREKNGWTCDAAVSAEHMLLNFTVENSLAEWMESIRAAQNKEGALPGIVPTGGWGFEWGNGPAWDRICVYIPYYIYKYTGEKDIIKDNVSLVMRYLTYIYSKRDSDGLIAIGLGDWVDPFEEEKGYISSPLKFTDSAMTYDIAKKAEFLFKEIGLNNESTYAKNIAVNMRRAIREALIDENFVVAGNCQTSQATALEIGLFDENELFKARKVLIEIVERDGVINTCGVIGLSYIFKALIKAGRTDLAYKIITGKSRTCYGYWIENGDTTLAENWRPVKHRLVASRNHHFLGDISSVFIQQFVGLQPNPNANDISFFIIEPHFPENMDFAEVSYISKFGEIFVRWSRENDKIAFKIVVPKGTHGKIIVGNQEKSWNKSDIQCDLTFNITISKI